MQLYIQGPRNYGNVSKKAIWQLFCVTTQESAIILAICFANMKLCNMSSGSA